MSQQLRLEEPRGAVGTSLEGLGTFLFLTFVGSWLPVIVLKNVWSHDSGSQVVNLLFGSILYALAMGWQPLLAALVSRRWVDRRPSGDAGIRRPQPAFFAIASLSPLALIATASLLAWSFGLDPARESGAVEITSWVRAIGYAMAMTSAVVLIWVQAFTEEVGWRGYFLAGLMERFGGWQGLFLHGLAWGVWYAPIFLLANDAVLIAPARAGVFVVTCVLLGSLLGWLRLASRSVLSSATANAVLTATAGLPLLLRGEDVGLRGAIYGPIGWIPMAILLIALLAGPCRRILRANAPARPMRPANAPIH